MKRTKVKESQVIESTDSDGVITVIESGGEELTNFEPENAKTRQQLWGVKLKHGAAIASKTRDWTRFEADAASMIAEQAQFVAWWDKTVTPLKHNKKVLQKSGGLSAAIDAEQQTGIGFRQVSLWRKRLKDTPKYINQLVIAARRKASEQDAASIRAAVEEEKERIRANAAPPLEGTYGCIVIDPPWKMEKIERDERPNQAAFDYPTMDEVELSDFAVESIAADDCHLFCWTTHKHLPMALRLLEAWGFRYVCTMVWHKPGGFQPVGLPQYNCEFVLYARRGSPKFKSTKDFSVCFNAPRREHSRKPDEFYDVIKRVTDDNQKRIDVFSREAREGFYQYGNEIGKFAS